MEIITGEGKMSNDERFSIKKFLDFTPLAWYKIFGLALKVFIIGLIIFGVKYGIDRIFPKPPSNINQPEIHVQPGATVHYEVTQQSEKKRPWWIPGPFVELFGEKTDEDEGINVGARFGGRWEW